ncbi:hypothetical protein AB8Q25_26275, partial [Klebsiella pneumoniae]
YDDNSKKGQKMSKGGALAKRAKTQNDSHGGRDLIIRKMEPSFPFAIRSIQADGIIILDFIGDEISPNKREAFASVLLTKTIAQDLKSKIDGYLAHQENNEE